LIYVLLVGQNLRTNSSCPVIGTSFIAHKNNHASTFIIAKRIVLSRNIKGEFAFDFIIRCCEEVADNPEAKQTGIQKISFKLDDLIMNFVDQPGIVAPV
jgi:hypothetical protein